MKIFWVLFLMLFTPALFSQNSPSVRFTEIPDWGSSQLLKGRISGENPASHYIAVYINVTDAGGWWTKPYLADPKTLIGTDSSFTTKIMIGGLDQFATQIIAFLLPSSISPPVLTGADLPAELFTYPYAVTCRPHGSRIINWAGFDWVVKKSVGSPLISMGPGPNLFSDQDSMVWVDNQNRMHMRIARNGSQWYSTELICGESRGYRKYTFDIAGRVDLLDPNIVAGFFTWDDCALLTVPANQAFREIDLELSKWKSPSNENSQYVIQPYGITGNLHRFNMNLTGCDHSVHTIDWRPDSISFSSRWGSNSHSWKYERKSGIPDPGFENIRINFWLISGLPPTDFRNAELILNSFAAGTDDHAEDPAKMAVYPNPSGTGVTIGLTVKTPGNTLVEIRTLQGIVVKKLFSGYLHPGYFKFQWDEKNEDQNTVPPGLYLVYFHNESASHVAKMVKL